MGAVVRPNLTFLHRATKYVTFTGGESVGAMGSVPLFDVTGEVLIDKLVPYCETALSEEAATATLALGVTGSTALLIAATNATDIDAGEFWVDATPDANGIAVPAALQDVAITDNIIGTVADQRVNGGALRLDVYWRPLSDDGKVQSADGVYAFYDPVGLAEAVALALSVQPGVTDTATLAETVAANINMSGTVSISPALVAELLTDPGLEVNYTAGKCDTLTANGAPTVAQSADVHGGSKAQEFTAVAQYNWLNWPLVTPTIGVWYQVFAWAKRTAGSNGTTRLVLSGGLPAYASVISDAAYTQKLFTNRATTADDLNFRIDEAGTTGFDTVLFDDGSIKALTFSSCVALVGDPGTRNGRYNCFPTLTADTQCGVVACCDDVTNPTYGLFAYHDGVNAKLDKLDNGTWSSLVTAVATYGAGRELQVRVNDTTASLWYSNGTSVVQIGTDQTVANIASYGTEFGGFSTYASNDPGTVGWQTSLS